MQRSRSRRAYQVETGETSPQKFEQSSRFPHAFIDNMRTVTTNVTTFTCCAEENCILTLENNYVLF